MKSLAKAVTGYKHWLATCDPATDWAGWGDHPYLGPAVGPVEPGSMVVVGGRTGAGKSMFLLQMMQATPAPSLYVSLEDSEHEVARRVGHPSWRQEDLERVALVTPTRRGLSGILESLRTHHEDARGFGGRPWVAYLDYLQLVQYDGAAGAFSRTDQIGNIISDFVSLGKELNFVPVMSVQIGRPPKGKAGEDNEPAPPQLYDIRDSSNIENGAHVVILLHSVGKDTLEVRVAKHKTAQSGVMGTFKRGPGGWLLHRRTNLATTQSEPETDRQLPLPFDPFQD